MDLPISFKSRTYAVVPPLILCAYATCIFHITYTGGQPVKLHVYMYRDKNRYNYVKKKKRTVIANVTLQKKVCYGRYQDYPFERSLIC